MPCGRPILLSKYGDDGLCGGFHRIVCELNSMNCRRIGMSAACYLPWAGRRRTPPRQPRRVEGGAAPSGDANPTPTGIRRASDDQGGEERLAAVARLW